jgi:hypothetical protein
MVEKWIFRYKTPYSNFSTTSDRRNLGTVDDASLDFFYKEKHGQTTCHPPFIIIIIIIEARTSSSIFIKLSMLGL